MHKVKAIKDDKEVSGNGSHSKVEVTARARELFASSGCWMGKQDAIEMGIESLISDRDELVEYVKALKILAVYLVGTNQIRPIQLSEEYFVKAEKNFSDTVRREIDIDVHS
jgi:hypothetical protein